MKTIQQVIRELNSEKIEKAYFYKHPIELYELNRFEDKTLGEIKKKISTRFQAFIERLRTMEIEENSEEQWVLFVYKALCNESFYGEEVVGLLRVDDLTEKDNLLEVETYAYEFTEQKEALGFLVADTKLTQDNVMDVVVDFLHELSFFGYEQEQLKEEMDKLEESINEIDEHPERLKTFDIDEIREKYNLPMDEEYPEEQEKKKKFHEAARDYTNYCKCIEMKKIKDSILKEKRTIM